MTLIDSGDGLYTDPETGEMFDIPAGTDRCLALARALFEAKAQGKAWEQRAAVAQAGLLEYQEERRAIYDDRAVSFRQNPVRRFDADAFRAWLEDATLAPGQLYELAMAAKDFDAGMIADEYLAGYVKAFRTETLGRPWLAVDVVRKVAPGGLK